MKEYLFFSDIGSDVEHKIYTHHKEAYEDFYYYIFKLKKKLESLDLLEDIDQGTTDGYDRFFKCSLGMVTCGQISDI